MSKKWEDRTIVGITEVAEWLGWARDSVYQARNRTRTAPGSTGALPEADEVIGGATPVWFRGTIETWARDTGRLQADGTVVKRRGGPAPAPLTDDQAERMRARLAEHESAGVS